MIVPQLNIRIRKEYSNKTVCNLFNDCKSKFLAWDELKIKWTGIGWDDNGCPVVDTNDEKWMAFLQVSND